MYTIRSSYILFIFLLQTSLCFAVERDTSRVWDHFTVNNGLAHNAVRDLEETSDRKLTLSSVGMPPLLLYRVETKRVEEILLQGMPLGITTSFEYDQYECDLYPGDTLLIMSDGASPNARIPKAIYLTTTAFRSTFTMLPTAHPRTFAHTCGRPEKPGPKVCLKTMTSPS